MKSKLLSTVLPVLRKQKFTMDLLFRGLDRLVVQTFKLLRTTQLVGLLTIIVGITLGLPVFIAGSFMKNLPEQVLLFFGGVVTFGWGLIMAAFGVMLMPLSWVLGDLEHDPAMIIFWATSVILWLGYIILRKILK